ncbi:hypothetical protein ACOSB0_00265, partial [Candidatus Phytoplasma citri]
WANLKEYESAATWFRPHLNPFSIHPSEREREREREREIIMNQKNKAAPVLYRQIYKMEN